MRLELPQFPSLKPRVHLSHTYAHSLLPPITGKETSLLLYKAHLVLCALYSNPLPYEAVLCSVALVVSDSL